EVQEETSMDARKGVTEGMPVYTQDGEKLGKVVSVDDAGLFVEKGLFFPKEYGFGFEDVEDVRDGSVHLRVSKDFLSTGHKGLHRSSRDADDTLDKAVEAAEQRAGKTVPPPVDEGEGVFVTGGPAITGDVRVVHRERPSSTEGARPADRRDPKDRG